MPWLTQLDDVARRTGHPVSIVSGWQSRGHGPQPEVRGIVCHHTAGAATGDYPSLRVVRDGRPGLDGPLSHFGLGRSGRIYVIAAGRCWHNAPSTSADHDNSSSIGIEAENTGLGQRWPDVQLRAYERLCAELCKEFRLPASRVKGHKEVQRGKIDPHGINMTDFRAAVSRLLAGEEDDMPLTDEDAHKVARAVHYYTMRSMLEGEEGRERPAHQFLRHSMAGAVESRRAAIDVREAVAKVAATQAAHGQVLSALASGVQLDMAAVQAAAEEGARRALAESTVAVDVTVRDDTQETA